MTSDTKHDTATKTLKKIPPEVLAQSEAEKIAIRQESKLQQATERICKPLRIVLEMQEKYGHIVGFAPTIEQLSDIYLFNLGKWVAKYELHEQGELDDLEHPSDEALTFIKGYAETFSKCMKEELADEKYKDKSFLDLFEEGADENCYADKPIFKDESLILEAIEGTRKRCNAPSVGGKKPKQLDMALDKVNSVFWGRDSEKVKAGENKKLNVSGKKGRAYIDLGFTFGELDKKKLKGLTAFDETVYSAISTLYNIGNDIVSLTQIHYAMGYTSRPDGSALKKIDESLTKLSLMMITVDRTADYTRYAKDEETLVYRGNLLYIERMDTYINGKFVKGAIHILREPYLMQMAREKAQITSFDRKLITTGLSKTDFNLKIQNYLLYRISRMKKSSKQKKISYSTMFEVLDVPKGKPQQRALKTMYECLTYWKDEKIGYITSYHEDGEGVEIVI